MENDDRGELASIAAALRAYLELQAASGATGLPRGVEPVRRAIGRGEVEEPADEAPLGVRPSAEPPAPSSPATKPATPSAPKPAAADARPVVPPPRVAAGMGLSDRDARLPLLSDEVAGCTKCRLSESRKQTVFARGNAAAPLCFVGEAPGADEDEQGLPFVGRAGQLLDRMIQAMGLSPERDVYITNIIRCRPPSNRKPEADEIAACLPYLHEQLDLTRPKVIVALGNTAAATLLGTTVGITKLRGEWKLYKGTILVMPTYHPSYLLRPSPQQVQAKKQAWEDLQAVMKKLDLPLPPKKNAKEPA